MTIEIGKNIAELLGLIGFFAFLLLVGYLSSRH